MGVYMKTRALTCCIFLGLLLNGCGGHSSTIEPSKLTETSIPASDTHEPTETAVPASDTPEPTETAVPSSNAPEPTKTDVPPTDTPTLQSKGSLPATVIVDGDTVIFDEWGFSIELPQDVWEFNPDMYDKTSNFEGFIFVRKEKLVDSTNEGYSPSVGIMFYSVPENTQLLNFSTILRTNMGANFPSIDNLFGYEGSEPTFKIPVLGYYGHLGEGINYSVYIVHTVKGTVGVQVSFEIVDSVLDKAKPEFFEIMQSLDFSQ